MEKVDPVRDAIAATDCPVAPCPDESQEAVITPSEKTAEQYPTLTQDNS